MNIKKIGKAALAIILGIVIGIVFFFMGNAITRIAESPEISEKFNSRFEAPQNGMISSDFTVELSVRLPKGSRLYVDGKEIRNKRPVENSTDELFIIGNVWKNTHKIKVTNPLAQTLEEEIYITEIYRDDDSWLSLYLRKEYEKEIEGKSKNVITQMLYSAAKQKKFSDVKIEKNIENNTLEHNYYQITSALDDAEKKRNAKISKITITDITDSPTALMKDDRNVKVFFFVDVEYLFKLNSGTFKKESETLAVTAHLTNIKGNWEVNALEFTNLPLSEE